MRDRAQLVIIGAGIVGCSTAYHLAQRSWKDIVVLDQGPLFHTGGSTSHAPGLVFQTNISKMMTHFAKYTVELIHNLSTEEKPTWYPVGGIEVAYTEARWQDLKRKHGWAQSYGLEAHLLNPTEVQAHVPIIDRNKIHGGYYVPTDGDADAVAASAAMAAFAESEGAAEFYGETTVTDLEVKDGHIVAVVTDKGRIKAEQVLLATNIWASVLADKVGLKIPVMACQHQYVITEPLAELAGERRPIVHPILRHQDSSMYFRQHADAYGIGSYQHEPLLLWPHQLGKTAMEPFTPEDFEGAWADTIDLLPPLRGKEWVEKFNGMFAFTPDGMPILGPAPNVEGLWAAIGVWVTHSGGVGWAIANWMDSGDPGMDIHEADISRYHAHVYSKAYTHARCAQQYREVYDIIHPLQQMEQPRPLRLPPFYDREVAQGGVFFEGAGWERPQWFDVNKRLLEDYDVPERSGWEARYWSPIQGAEHLATREKVALFDLGAFTKIQVEGPGALSYLNWLAANQIDQPVGKVTYTSLLTEQGGIKCDLTITRVAEDSFLILTGGGMGMHDLAWIRDQAPPDGSVTVTDVTSRYTSVGLWGPAAREVLSSVCEDDISDEGFPYFTARSLMIDAVPAFALRVSYVGELGWEIYTTTEYGLRLWDVLWQAGQTHGLIAAGGGAFDSLRLEKGYRLWGNELHTEYNPYEAGISWTVRLKKGDFLGREALLRMKEQGVSRKLCCLTFTTPEGIALGKEPILHGGTPVGYVTSANYGYSVGKYIAYGYLPIELAEDGAELAVEYFGTQHPVVLTSEPLYDPKNEKLKG